MFLHYSKDSKHLKYLALLWLFCAQTLMAQSCVVLLHGLLRSPAAMEELEHYLGDKGYSVVNQGYPSRDASIENLAAPAINAALNQCQQLFNHNTALISNAGALQKEYKDDKDYKYDQDYEVHFVTHSLGGILVRYYVQNTAIHNLGRVVMLGPPNQGSQVVDAYNAVPGFAFMNGPAGSQLGTDVHSMPAQLGPVEFELGIVAGSKSWNFILSQFLPNPDDGKVSVENTKVKGMQDHIVLPVTHTFMMDNKKVQQQVLHFLKFGYFSR